MREALKVSLQFYWDDPIDRTHRWRFYETTSGLARVSHFFLKSIAVQTYVVPILNEAYERSKQGFLKNTN